MYERTHKKLREAGYFLRLMSADSGKWFRQEPEAVDFYISAFVSAARAVTFVLHKERPDVYERWRDDWFDRLALQEPELAKLADFFIDQRNKGQKEGGGDLETIKTEVSLSQFLHETAMEGGHTYISPGVPGTPQPTFTKHENRFAGWSNEPIPDVCRRYLDLMERFVREFEAAHSD
jgi:ribonucleotide reductase alpha subunit